MAPQGLTEIGYGTFYGCESLRRIVLNDSLEVLEDYQDRDSGDYFGIF